MNISENVDVFWRSVLDERGEGRIIWTEILEEQNQPQLYTYTRFQAYQVRGYTTYHDYLGHIQLELMLKSIVDGNFACKCIFMT